MPEFKLPFRKYQLAEAPDKRDAVINLGDGDVHTTRAFEVMYRRDKTLIINSDRALDFEAYIVPYSTAPENEWLLYKTGLTINANDPFIFFSNDAIPYIAFKLSNSSGNAAVIKGWLCCQ